MADQAKVSSIDDLEAFRTALILFISDGQRSLDEVIDGVRRTRTWLEQDRRPHWERELQRRKRILQELEAELFGARLSPLRDATAKQQEDVRRGRRAVAEAEEKLRLTKKWIRDYEGTVAPMAKRLDGLRHFLDHDLVKALAFLVTAQRTLESYASIRIDNLAPEPTAPSPSEPTP